MGSRDVRGSDSLPVDQVRCTPCRRPPQHDAGACRHHHRGSRFRPFRRFRQAALGNRLPRLEAPQVARARPSRAAGPRPTAESGILASPFPHRESRTPPFPASTPSAPSTPAAATSPPPAPAPPPPPPPPEEAGREFARPSLRLLEAARTRGGPLPAVAPRCPGGDRGRDRCRHHDQPAHCGSGAARGGASGVSRLRQAGGGGGRCRRGARRRAGSPCRARRGAP